LTSAEQLAQGQLSFSLLLELALKLGLVIVLIYFSFYLLKRYSQHTGTLPWAKSLAKSGTDQSIQTLCVHPLGHQATLYLLEVDAQRLLVSVSPQQVQVLSQWPSPAQDINPTTES